MRTFDRQERQKLGRNNLTLVLTLDLRANLWQTYVAILEFIVACLYRGQFRNL